MKKSHKSMIRTKQKLVLLYYKSNRYLYPEKFSYDLLLLFYPFVNESDLFLKGRTYSGKMQETIVCATINENEQILEPHSELIDTLLSEI